MTTQTKYDEALSIVDTMKLALEALVEMTPSGPNGSAIWHKQMSAITAVSEALAQQSNEQVEPVAWIDKNGNIDSGWDSILDEKEWKPLYTHPPVPYVVEPRTAQLKEPGQRNVSEHLEPVAWVHTEELEELEHCNGMNLWAENAATHTEDSIAKQLKPSGYVPLYTTPPQRKPLTDEGIDAAIKCAKKVDTGYAGWVRDQRREFARAIEAAHGIKE